jgi:hypothetical protein
MIILAALFFGLITLGFTLLTVVPFIFLFLLVGVYMEPRADPAAASGDIPLTVRTRTPGRHRIHAVNVETVPPVV